MKRKLTYTLIIAVICLLVVSGLALFKNAKKNQNNHQPIASISLTEREKEISELSFSFLVGYEFQNLGEAEIRINLVHNGQVIQNYESFFSHEDNPLKKIWIGFENIDNVNYNIVLKQENELGSGVGKIDSECMAKNESGSVSQVLYVPEQWDTNQNIIVLGALCLSTEGISDADNTTLFNTKNFSDMQQLYQSLSQQPGYEYCYIIELHF